MVHVLRMVNAFVLLFAVAHASDQVGASSCLHTKLGVESSGVSVFEIPTNAVSGNIM